MSRIARLAVLLTLASGCLAEDEILFGPPDTLRRLVTTAGGGGGGTGACPLPQGLTAGSCPSWSGAVFPLLVKLNCAATGCHAPGAGGFEPRIAGNNADTTYDNLLGFKSPKAAVAGRPYIGAADAYILCNLNWEGEPAGKPTLDTTEMPSAGTVSAADIKVIAEWVQCGSPKAGGAGGGGGGGVGGAGGAGGGM